MDSFFSLFHPELSTCELFPLCLSLQAFTGHGFSLFVFCVVRLMFLETFLSLLFVCLCLCVVFIFLLCA